MNERGAFSFNNVTAKANKDGAITIRFGGCEDNRINCLPISKAWNFAARIYQPREEILIGSWTFPVPKPVKRKGLVAQQVADEESVESGLAAIGADRKAEIV